MRRYDDPVDVRKGMVGGPDGAAVEAPEQFLWRGRLWKVCDVVAHWVETGPWWQSGGVRGVLGVEDEKGPAADRWESRGAPDPAAGPRAAGLDPGAEREVWRVEAARGRTASTGPETGRGVFDLVFDWTEGSWQLARCLD